MTSNEAIMDIGKRCKHPSCNLVDFLPFKCDHCKESFCQEHFKVADHQCPKYDEFQHNRIAPDCPFCNVPVTVKQGQDPNERLEQHFNNECPVYTGKSVPKKSPTCARGKCGKVLFSPIRCEKCSKQFCASHRFPSEHNCAAASTTPAPTTAAAPRDAVGKRLANLASGSRLLNLHDGPKKPLVAKKPVAAAPPAAKQAPSKAEEPTSKTPMPFSKTDRRAKAEKESRMKAMRARAQKGLLSEKEKATLAELEAEAKKDKDCLIM